MADYSQIKQILSEQPNSKEEAIERDRLERSITTVREQRLLDNPMNFYQELSNLTYSQDCYISGMLALNIADYENNTGDWHRGTFWNENSKISSSHIMGKNSPVSQIDTSKYFGKVGIFKANDTLKRMGIPEFSNNIISANHERSIADLVVYFALQNKNPCSVIDFYSFDDFMELPSDKEKVFSLLDMAIKNLSDDNARKIVADWLNKAKNFNYE